MSEDEVTGRSPEMESPAELLAQKVSSESQPEGSTGGRSETNEGSGSLRGSRDHAEGSGSLQDSQGHEGEGDAELGGSPYSQLDLLSKHELEYIQAKSYLLTTSTETSLNLYDHLCCILTKVLAERPDDVVDIIEDLSKEAKKSKFSQDADTIQDKMDPSTEVALAKIETKLFVRGEEEEDIDEEVEMPLPNLLELCFMFEQGGLGLGREEIMRVWLALNMLVDMHPLQHVRFWGKIFGTEQNYYVAEVEYREGEDEEEEEEEEAEAEEPENLKDKNEDEEDEEADEDIIPKPDFKSPPVIPKEEKGTGANKKSYFVCNDHDSLTPPYTAYMTLNLCLSVAFSAALHAKAWPAGKPWTRLPLVTPAQIKVSRQIKKYFTGKLDMPIITYPPFPGNESNYLRAQIARISAGTHISPMGFYQFDEEEEEEEEEGAVRDNFVENLDFERVPVRELTEPTLSNWVHHVLHILPQGRCTWWNPSQKGEEEMEEENEDEEEREEAEEPEPEVGPPLLTPLSEDAEIAGLPPWSTKMSTQLIQQYALAIVDSNLWPGAHAFAYNKKFENIYIGWGHKYSPDNYSPPPVPSVQEEFSSGPEITEIEDPTPEEEAALRAAQQAAAEAAEEAEEEEEEIEDEDDD